MRNQLCQGNKQKIKCVAIKVLSTHVQTIFVARSSEAPSFLELCDPPSTARDPHSLLHEQLKVIPTLHVLEESLTSKHQRIWGFYSPNRMYSKNFDRPYLVINASPYLFNFNYNNENERTYFHIEGSEIMD